MKIITIVGARPQFIKAAMVSRAIIRHNTHNSNKIDERILHTGQHYDPNMSDVFFKQLKIPKPNWRLECGQGSHTEMTAKIMLETAAILIDEKPDYVIVYGDTNSTLAGALTAAKMHIPVVHIEAGLRSFNKAMPEEINRILTDHISDLLFCPTLAAVQNLKNENITKGVYNVGDVMYDAALAFGKYAEETSNIMRGMKLTHKEFCLCTVHRAENTDDPTRLTSILRALVETAKPNRPVIMPLHPRTQRFIKEMNLESLALSNPYLKLIEPVNYLDMIVLERNAAVILTDSGGVQKEAYFHGTPCITLRKETEWVETVEHGWNQLAGYQTDSILHCLQNHPEQTPIDEYGKGDAAEKITEIIANESFRL